MADLLIHPDLTPGGLGPPLHDPVDDINILRDFKLVVQLRHRERDGDGDPLDVLGDLEEARVAREAGVVHGPAVVGLVLRVGEEDDVLAAPAEARRADRYARSSLPAQVLEELLDDGKALSGTVPKDPGDKSPHGPEDVIRHGEVAAGLHDAVHVGHEPGRARMAWADRKYGVGLFPSVCYG